MIELTWDVRQDTTTGDWVYTGHRDLMHSDGEDHIYQRIVTRLKIPRGEYLYDTSGSLGSELPETVRGLMDKTLPEVPTIIQEALAPMTDIRVNDIRLDTVEDDPSAVRASISYVNVVLPGEAALDLGETPGEIFVADIQL